MKAISLWEPWATAIALGLKKIETRGWYTAYRGPLAIHAAKTRDHAEFIFEPEIKLLFAANGIHAVNALPFGCIVATCTLTDCRRTEEIAPMLGWQEIFFGNYDTGRFAWMLKDVVRLPVPIPARGSQGFWNWDPSLSTHNQS